MGDRVAKPEDALLSDHFAQSIGLPQRKVPVENTPSNMPIDYLKGTKEATPDFNQAFDSADEAATKKAVEDFLGGVQTQANIKLPVQYDNPTAEKLYRLFFEATTAGDAEQGIKSQLYQSPSNGKIVFCRDTRGYDKDKAVDPCYDYARYGIGLFLSQHLLYQSYGIKDTAFITDNAQKFYEQFIADIKRYEGKLSLNLFLSDAEKSEALRKYAQVCLSDAAHSIAQQLTDRLGAKHEEFKNAKESLASLDMVVVSASMAFQAIPYATLENFEYSDGTTKVSKNFVSIVHPKPAKMTSEIAELYEDFELPIQDKDNAPSGREQRPRSFSDVERNFLDKLKPAKKRLIRYFREAILGGTVTLCSQDRGKLVGNKNASALGTYTWSGDKGNIQLQCHGYFVGNSTPLAAFRNTAEEELVDYTRRTLLQLYETLRRGASSASKRGLRLCPTALCGIDVKTTLDNRGRPEATRIDVVDSKSVWITSAAAKETMNIFDNNFAINLEGSLVLIDGDGALSKLAQGALAAVTGYENLQEMMPYVRHAAGIKENVAYIKAFKEQFAGKLSADDAYRLEQYLSLMDKALAAVDNCSPLSSSEVFKDAIASFNLLCNVHNELIVKYDRDEDFDFIMPPINCASGENRTGSVLFHCMVLARLAEIVRVDHVHELLDPKYYELRRAIGDEFARMDVIGKNNGACGSTGGTDSIRYKNKDCVSKNDVNAKVLNESMCRPSANLKTLMPPNSSAKEGEFVYVEDKNRVDILSDERVKEIALNTTMSEEARKTAYQNLIASFSDDAIRYTLKSLRDPMALSWLPREDFKLILGIFVQRIDKAPIQQGAMIYDNLSSHLGVAKCRDELLLAPTATTVPRSMVVGPKKVEVETVAKPVLDNKAMATAKKSIGFIGKAINAITDAVDLKVGARIGAVMAGFSIVLTVMLGHAIGITLLSTFMGGVAMLLGWNCAKTETETDTQFKQERASLGWGGPMENSKFGFFRSHQLVVKDEIPHITPSPIA